MTPDAPGPALAATRRHRASAILRCGDREVARQAMQAAVRAGFRVVEVTLTTPGAYDLIGELAADPRLVVGAGTVLDEAAAERAVAAGASFLVSPVTDPAVIARARELGAVAIPGAHTPTEMLAAHRAGADLVKLFPAPAGGPAWLRAVLGPLPFLEVVPTHGTDAANAAEWLAAGAAALGFVASLFAAEDLAAGAWDRIEERGREILAAVAAAPHRAG